MAINAGLDITMGDITNGINDHKAAVIKFILIRFKNNGSDIHSLNNLHDQIHELRKMGINWPEFDIILKSVDAAADEWESKQIEDY
jgi:hypothetical protein